MFIAGALNLNAAKEEINELNVFPVPDGDTGTNMTMTIMSAVDAVRALDEVGMESLAKAMSGGSLRGARGNSGVILSQLCRGFSKVIRDQDAVTVELMAVAAERAVETAYKAVIKPKEGTILTVARGVAKKVRALAEEEGMDLERLMAGSIEYGKEVLERTPDMLPVLKEAGVVDSGGKGLIYFIEGAYKELIGAFDEKMLAEQMAARTPVRPAVSSAASVEKTDIKYGYCTEFIINRKEPMPEEEIRKFKSYLTSIGDSLVLVADDEIVKIHVHTNDPGEAITRALTYGMLTNLKIDNMRVEHQEKVIKEAVRLAKEQAEADGNEEETPKEKKETGFISVCSGSGFASLFAELSVDRVIEGGQTMNPSTEDFIAAIREVNAKTVYIFPNNSNIILAANQARDLTEDCKVVVIPTKTVPQAVTAILAFDPAASTKDNEAAMCDVIGCVKTAQITYAVRDTSLDGFEIKKDDIMAVGDNGLLAVGSEIGAVAIEAVKKMGAEEAELISVYYGADFSAEDAEALGDEILDLCPDCDIAVNEGGQPVYYCVIAVE